MTALRCQPVHVQPPVLFDRRPLAAVAALVALGTAAFCFVTAENLPVGLLPIISASLKVSVPAVGLLVTAYAFVVVIASAPLAHLTRRVPRRLLICVLLGTFIISVLAGAAATGYWWLMSARVVTAMTQAVFWAVAAVAAVGLFPVRLRARAVAGVLGGGSFAVVLGVPVATWLGDQGGWRLPYLALAGLAGVSLTFVALLLPSSDPAESHAAAGAQPDRRRFYLLVAMTVLVVSGMFTAYTYISTFLTRVSGLAPHDVALALLVAGASSSTGVITAGAFYDRYPRFITVTPFALVTGGLLGLWAFGHSTAAAVLMQCIISMGVGGFVISNQNRVLIVAPGSSDVASAWASASFNVGIAGGSLAGGLVVSTLGVKSAPLVGGLMAGAALVMVVGDHLGTARRTPLASS